MKYIIPHRHRPRIRALARLFNAAAPLTSGLRSYYHVSAHPTPHCITLCGRDYDARPLDDATRGRLQDIAHRIHRNLPPGWRFEGSRLVFPITRDELRPA